MSIEPSAVFLTFVSVRSGAPDYSFVMSKRPSVMPGLVPGISLGAIVAAEVDARNKSGHDGMGPPGRPFRNATPFIRGH